MAKGKDWEKVANGLQQQIKVLRQQNRKLKEQLKMEGIKRAFETFKNGSDYYTAFDSSTKASWGGSGYSVELFPDGHYRVQWDNQFGNLYNSPGLILGIPVLGDDEWDEDPELRFYGNAEEALQSAFDETIEETLDNAE